jgi:para-aminobenzoate synthetase component 1
MLNWARQFNIFCFMDHNGYAIHPHRYECVLAAGAASVFSYNHPSEPGFLKDVSQKDTWSFGHIAYEGGYRYFDIPVTKGNPIGFPYAFFFQPQYLLYIWNDQLYIEAPDADALYEQIVLEPDVEEAISSPITINQRLSREEYIEKVKTLQQHILRGDCYEVNFCQEFFTEAVDINPIGVYNRLNALSPNPFSVLYKLEDKYLICASPERFLYKEGERIVSQPIKGTARRALDNKELDDKLKDSLLRSAKEQSENVMIVDLVRNDLSRICQEGSVKVDELMGIYSYPQVHQMISTISGKLDGERSLAEIIEATFPMGSMTGAPKKRVMELINQYEPVSRGIFSGSVGYINPEGDFDFNVVIRSIMYNSSSRYLSYQVGSGITFYCNAEQEWEECLLKGEAIKKVLTG